MAALAYPFASQKVVSPFLEMGAYEALWMQHGASFKTIAEKFRTQPGALPSDLVLPEIASNTADRAMRLASRYGVMDFGSGFTAQVSILRNYETRYTPWNCFTFEVGGTLSRCVP